MVDNSTVRPRKKAEYPSGEFAMPEALRLRLGRWIDVDEVGAAGFWRWLETVLPILPSKGLVGDRLADGRAPSIPRLQELARDLVDCAGDRARLTIACEQYFSDNRALSMRVKALEAAVRSFERSGPTRAVDEDPETGQIAERYLPRR